MKIEMARIEIIHSEKQRGKKDFKKNELSLGSGEATSKGLTYVPLEFQKEMRECGADKNI